MTNDNETILKVQDSMRELRDDQLGAILTTCHRIMDTDGSVLAREAARILRLQVLAELARRGEKAGV